MKVAICFWGLTRSLKYTIHSIRAKILKQLDDKNIEYKIFLHTYVFDSAYNNPRANERNIKLDFDEYKLLNPDYVEIDNQDQIKKQIGLEKYRTQKDPWETNYVSVDNYLCAMYSKKRLGQMLQASNQQFDAYLFLRPDVMFLNNFDVRYLTLIRNDVVCIPNFALFPKFNDRAFLCSKHNVYKYTNLFDELYVYSKTHELHSERSQYNLLVFLHKLKIQYIPFHFTRVRANGIILNDLKRNKRGNRMTFINSRQNNHIVPVVTRSEQQTKPKNKRHNIPNNLFFRM